MNSHSPAADAAVERYLERIREGLRGMPRSEVDDIVRELRAHVEERSEAEGDRESALRSLGDPAELARQYRKERVVRRVECSRSPLAVLHGLLLLRGRSVAGWAALLLAGLGYAWAIALAAAAVDKVFEPRDVGLWLDPGGWLPRLRVDGPGPPGTRELLGWWLVPLGLVACAVLVSLTRRFGLWWIHRSRDRRASITT
ncbi:MAG TPA: DUF1700 domain-containing protein [Candidatus Omnitrophota bacterium]|jgi:hypothetical protein|nr:DUF1700 domain-containing protein [Candidatus Omnitrophota bacterium]